MPCWDGGAAQQPEDEREEQDAWEDPSDGDLPWEPNRVDRPEPWKRPEYPGPEWRMWMDLLRDEDEEA